MGKWAYLTTDPVTIQEGKRAIAQAVLDNRVKARGPRHPLQKMCLEIEVLTIHSHLASPLEAENTIRDRETRGHYHLGSLHLLWTMVLRAIGVYYQQRLQCHPDLTAQTDQGIPDEVDNTEKKHA